MERFANNPVATLVLAIDAVTTSVSVDDASGFPSDGTFRLAVGDELMLVTGVSSNTFTVERGIEGSTAATHAVATGVTAVLTAGAIAQLKADLIGAGDFASRPAAGNEGALYLHDGALSRDDGTSWSEYGPLRTFTPPGSYSGWAYGRSSTNANMNEWGGGQFTFDHKPGDGSKHRLATYVRPMPNTTDIKISSELSTAHSGEEGLAGICFRDQGRIFSLVTDTELNGSAMRLWFRVYEHAIENGTSGTVHSSRTLNVSGGSVKFRLGFANNTLTADFAFESSPWNPLSSVSTTAFTPTQGGFVTGAGSPATWPIIQMAAHSWDEEY